MIPCSFPDKNNKFIIVYNALYEVILDRLSCEFLIPSILSNLSYKMTYMLKILPSLESISFYFYIPVYSYLHLIGVLFSCIHNFFK